MRLKEFLISISVFFGCFIQLNTTAQIIDTIYDTWITTNDSLNQRIKIVSGIDLEISNPSLYTRRGYKLKYGWHNYYLHIITATDIKVNGYRLANRGQKTYLAVVSFSKKNPEVPIPYKTHCLYLKGMIDYADSLEKYYVRSFKEAGEKLDSLKELETKFKEEGNIPKTLTDLINQVKFFQQECSWYSYLYYEFQMDRDNPKDLLIYFLSNYYHKSLKFNTFSDPHGLPALPPKDPPDKIRTPFWDKIFKLICPPPPPMEPTEQKHGG